MIPIDTIVSIKSGDEYGGKYTGKLGIIKKFTDDRVGVEFAGLKNHASKYGLFWFKKENVTPSLFDAPKRNDAIIPAALAKAFLNFTFGAPRASLGVKQVIFSGPKTIVFWLDGTKTIVSCGEGGHNETIACLNVCRKKYLETKDKKYWWQMIQLLPSSYNQRRTVMLNYEVLANIYKSRRHHKLDEWHTLCDWIEGLPYSALITGTAV